jgi:hypothetical protein
MPHQQRKPAESPEQVAIAVVEIEDCHNRMMQLGSPKSGGVVMRAQLAGTLVARLPCRFFSMIFAKALLPVDLGRRDVLVGARFGLAQISKNTVSSSPWRWASI